MFLHLPTLRLLLVFYSIELVIERNLDSDLDFDFSR